MAVEAGQSSTGTVKTELRENAVGLPGILMQGIATIGPSFAILASFVFIVGFAGLVTPWAFLFGIIVARPIAKTLLNSAPEIQRMMSKSWLHVSSQIPPLSFGSIDQPPTFAGGSRVAELMIMIFPSSPALIDFSTFTKE